MLMDNNLSFSSAQAITASAASTYTIDLLTGQKLTTASDNFVTGANSNVIGNATVFGEDLGIGRGKGTPRIVVSSGAGTPAAATSLVIAFQGAADPGASGAVSGLSMIPYIQTRAIPLASILASSRLASFDWPMREVKAALPRFVNLGYTVAGSNFTGLTVYADVTLGPDDATNTLGQYPGNF